MLSYCAHLNALSIMSEQDSLLLASLYNIRSVYLQPEEAVKDKHDSSFYYQEQIHRYSSLWWLPVAFATQPAVGEQVKLKDEDKVM